MKSLGLRRGIGMLDFMGAISVWHRKSEGTVILVSLNS